MPTPHATKLPGCSGASLQQPALRVLVAAAGFNRIGGIEIYTRTLGDVLSGTGNDVHYLATNYQGDGFSALPDGQRHNLSSTPLSVRKPFAAARLVNRLRPDLLVVNHCSLMHYAMPLLDPRIRPVVILHSDDPRFYEVAARFRESVFRWVAPTPGLASRFGGYIADVERGRIRVIPHGIDETVFSPPPQPRSGHSPRIVFLGFVAENKGADLLPGIMSRVWVKQQDANLVVVGYGPLRPQLERAFSDLGATERVTFRGELRPAEVAEVLRESDLLLLPTQIEGFGLAIAEAMMCGTVPVVSRLGGVTDSIVEDGTTGRLVGPRDVAGFANAVVELLNNRPALAQMSHAAAACAQARFSAQRMIDSYYAVFNEDDDRKVRRAGVFRWAARTARQVLRDRMLGRRRAAPQRTSGVECAPRGSHEY